MNKIQELYKTLSPIDNNAYNFLNISGSKSLDITTDEDFINIDVLNNSIEKIKLFSSMDVEGQEKKEAIFRNSFSTAEVNLSSGKPLKYYSVNISNLSGDSSNEEAVNNLVLERSAAKENFEGSIFKKVPNEDYIKIENDTPKFKHYYSSDDSCSFASDITSDTKLENIIPTTICDSNVYVKNLCLDNIKFKGKDIIYTSEQEQPQPIQTLGYIIEEGGKVLFHMNDENNTSLKYRLKVEDGSYNLYVYKDSLYGYTVFETENVLEDGPSILMFGDYAQTAINFVEYEEPKKVKFVLSEDKKTLSICVNKIIEVEGDLVEDNLEATNGNS